MKECIEALQELRWMQLHEINSGLDLAEENDFSLASMPEKCPTLANEANVIVLFDNVQSLPLLSQSNIGGLDSITSQDISLTQSCSNLEKSVEHTSLVDLMDAQEVKISEVSDMSNDLRMVIVKDNKPVLEEIKLTNDENVELPKKMKAIVNSGLEVEETTANK
jgi:hypothetical protein